MKLSNCPDVETFMSGLKKRNPHETEFHQAVREVAETLVPFVNDHPEYREAQILEEYLPAAVSEDELRAAIEAVGAVLLFLPPYSPDFNPIEQAFAKLKSLLRKAAARTVEALDVAIAMALDAFTPHECANYFTNSGYEPD